MKPDVNMDLQSHTTKEWSAKKKKTKQNKKAKKKQNKKQSNHPL